MFLVTSLAITTIKDLRFQTQSLASQTIVILDNQKAPRHPSFLLNYNSTSLSFPPSFSLLTLFLFLSLTLTPTLFLFLSLFLFISLSCMHVQAESASRKCRRDRPWTNFVAPHLSRKCGRALSIPHSVSQSIQGILKGEVSLYC
jgi:hypothetical protein